ncbi:MAG: hypothetical protein JSV91_10310 [Phycisphaerales bacterium]|nr:MAG: hypothetical protein JSV91_10310 [Phycisphaerales bacterium]
MKPSADAAGVPARPIAATKPSVIGINLADEFTAIFLPPQGDQGRQTGAALRGGHAAGKHLIINSLP